MFSASRVGFVGTDDDSSVSVAPFTPQQTAVLGGIVATEVDNRTVEPLLSST